MMKSLYEELGGTYTLGDDGMLYPDLAIGEKDSRPIGKWGRMHMKYLEAEHPGLYERLSLKGTLNRHLADANERAIRMLERLIVQMAAQEGITESFRGGPRFPLLVFRTTYSGAHPSGISKPNASQILTWSPTNGVSVDFVLGCSTYRIRRIPKWLLFSSIHISKRYARFGVVKIMKCAKSIHMYFIR